MAQPVDEFDLIARFFEPLARDMPGAFGLRDDAAVLRPDAGYELVVSADAIVAGIHFLDTSRPDEIARRGLRVNLSDIAGKGAVPLAYTLTLQLPSETDEEWLSSFSGGLAQDQREFGIGLLGGDTTLTPGPLSLSINIFGQAFENKLIKRSSSRENDDVYVTGTIGDAFLGLAIEKGEIDLSSSHDRAELVDRYRIPQPRVFVGPKLVGHANASADVSDGLVADLGHICEASGLRADLSLSSIPLSSAARSTVTDNQPLHLSLLAGGDDYEIVFTAPKTAHDALVAISRESGVLITRIGRMVEHKIGAPRVIVRDIAGDQLALINGGYKHFGRSV
ncbi:MAG: thiamine-phosphate kinase [Alphaproteobacteria bacterium]|nr:thiamine-phosphate kinase [Alphaproteobacteria bacterium]